MHDIEKDKFVSFKVPAWHSIGTVFQEKLLASEATRLAKADYEVIKVPHEIWHEGVLLDTVYDLVRLPHNDDDADYYGTVTADYDVTNNMDLAFLLDPLSQQYHTETVGVLSEGKRVFWTFATGTFDIRGEEIKGHILVTEAKNGRGGLRIIVTPVRVVCQNTLTLGLKQGTILQNIGHSHDPLAAMKFWADVMPKIEAANVATQRAMEALAQIKLDAEQTEMLLLEAFPVPRKSSKAALKNNEPVYLDLPEDMRTEVDSASLKSDYYDRRQAGFRASTKALLERFNDEYPATAGTAWAVTNAIAEHEDHRRVSGDERGSAIFGDRMLNKQRAFAAAFKLAGIS